MSSLVWLTPVFSLKTIESLSPCSRLMPLKLGILGELVDLRAQIVELLDQVRADRSCSTVGHAGGGVGGGEAEQRVGVGGGLRRWRSQPSRRAAAEADLEVVGAGALDVQLAVFVDGGGGDARLVDLVDDVADGRGRGQRGVV